MSVLASTSLAFAGTLSPASASPASAQDTITVHWASSTIQESGLLQISLTADSAITSLSADLFPVGSSSTTPAWTVTDFGAPASEPGGAELYTAAAPIPGAPAPENCRSAITRSR